MTDDQPALWRRQAPPASADELRAALADANIPTLLLAMAQLTGDHASWLCERYQPRRPRGVEDDDTAGLPEDVQQDIRERALQTVLDHRAGRIAAGPAPAPEQIIEMLQYSLGDSQEIPDEYGGLMAEELGVQPRTVTPSEPVPDDYHVLVFGAGLSGICAGVHLRKAGIPFTVIERNTSVGGTWLENTYPGCGVDTPSHLYSFSFAQSPEWSRYFAKRDELYAYLERLTDDYGLRDSIAFEREIVSAHWHEDGQRWHVTTRTAHGDEEVLVGNAIISGTGFFSQPTFPDIPGLDGFAGEMTHTARWDHSIDLTGKRVAVIGTGASAMQLVPAIADQVAHLTIFQRSPQWGLPNPNYMRHVSDGARTLMREIPYYTGWYRVRQVWNFGDRLYPALQIDPDWPHPERATNEMNDRHRQFLTRYIESELGEARDELIDKCLPTYPPYGKRPLLDNGWFRTVKRDDVALVTEAVSEIRPEGPVDATGTLHECDVLVIATGFKALEMLGSIEVRGRSGRTLRETWGEDNAAAYLGITVPDFPNFFFLLGPNTFAGHGGSAALSIEMEMRYALQLITHMIDTGATSVDCRQEVFDDYIAQIDERLNQTIWAHRGMTTYYRNSKGRIVVPMPWTNVDYWHMTREPNLDDFNITIPVAAT